VLKNKERGGVKIWASDMVVTVVAAIVTAVAATVMVAAAAAVALR
jgi:hypothetical protein